jgi:hypothetical protein
VNKDPYNLGAKKSDAGSGANSSKSSPGHVTPEVEQAQK